jgi:hypothetical protein
MPYKWKPRISVYPELFDKPQVRAISRATGRDRHSVVGCLVAVWLKFQERADPEGNFLGKPPEYVDLLTECSGFGAAMVAAGWLVAEAGGIRVPNFHEFVSKDAVRRAEKTEQRAAQRAGRADSRGDSADIAATTGDKVATSGADAQAALVAPTPVPTKKPGGAAVGSPLFDRFWAAYPKKKAKADAEKAFAKLDATEDLLARILAAIERQARSEAWRKDGGQFIPHPATWLNGRRWEDEVGNGPGHGGSVQPLGRVQSPPGKYANLKRHIVADAGDTPQPDPDDGPRKPPTSLFPDEDP